MGKILDEETNKMEVELASIHKDLAELLALEEPMWKRRVAASGLALCLLWEEEWRLELHWRARNIRNMYQLGKEEKSSNQEPD